MKNHNLYLSIDKGAALWFQFSGALSMYYLFAGQVKCMHTLPPNYNGTRQNKLRNSENNLLIPRQYHKKSIFFTDTVYHIYHLPGVTVQPRSTHNQVSTWTNETAGPSKSSAFTHGSSAKHQWAEAALLIKNYSNYFKSSH